MNTASREKLKEELRQEIYDLAIAKETLPQRRKLWLSAHFGALSAVVNAVKKPVGGRYSIQFVSAVFRGDRSNPLIEAAFKKLGAPEF